MPQAVLMIEKLAHGECLFSVFYECENMWNAAVSKYEMQQ